MRSRDMKTSSPARAGGRADAFRRPAGTRSMPLGAMDFGPGVSDELQAELAAGPPEDYPPQKPNRGASESDEEDD